MKHIYSSTFALRLLLALSVLLFAISAYAETWMMPNEAGGQIVLTDRPCTKYNHLMQMYTRTSKGDTWHGCWAYYDGLVHVVLDGGNKEYTYDPAHFVKYNGV
jgi:hypothetical protein